MWRAAAGQKPVIAGPKPTITAKKPSLQKDADDWDTDPDFVNEVSEKEQRWGAKTVESSGHVGSIDIKKLREDVQKDDQQLKKAAYDAGPKASEGYGGKFGVQSDRKDKAALGWEHHEAVDKHASQKDYATGFGGKYGVQQDRVDKSAVGWEHHESVDKHASQKDYAKGFGGKYGVQQDRVDKSAVGWDYKENLQQHESQKDYAKGFGGKYGVQDDRMDKSAVGYQYREDLQQHESQKDYSKGFGGKYGVQSDRVDKSAKGWSEHTKPELHPSQTDAKKGFGGKFGVETDRVDKSARGWEDKEATQMHESQVDHKKGFGGKFGVQTDRMDRSASGYEGAGGQPVGTDYQRTKPESSSEGARNLKARFEKMAMASGEEDKKRAEEERARRQEREKKEREEWKEREAERQARMPAYEEEEEPEQRASPAAVTVPAPRRELPHRPISAQQEEELYEEADSRLGPSQEDEDEALYQEADSGPPKRMSYGQPEEPEQDQYEDVGSVRAQAQAPSYEENLYDSADPTPSDIAPYEDQPTYDEAAPPTSSGNKAVAIFDYEATDDDELTFDPGEMITDIEFIDDGWWRGVCRGKVGLFPANYVELQ